jgi:ribonucleoside-diphosphate reductase beta chain
MSRKPASEYVESRDIFRLSMFPIKANDIWKLYKEVQEQFWVEEEIDKELAKDKKHWDELDPKIQRLVMHVLAFFAVSDGLVGEIIEDQILSRIEMREAKLWYNFKNMMEDIHNITYAKLVQTYVPDTDEMTRVLNAVEQYPVIKQKIAWIKRWTDSDDLLLSKSEREAVQLLLDEHDILVDTITRAGSVAQQPHSIATLRRKLKQPKTPLSRIIFIEAVLEGIFFSGSFCVIFWVFHQYGKLPGLTKANEFISRDEGKHVLFDVLFYNRYITNKLSQDQAHDIVSEAVEIESQFISEALPEGLPGMNSKLMTQYIQFVADQLLQQLQYDKLFGTANPFDFMEKQSVSVRMSDFFVDGNVSEYGHHAAGTEAGDNDLDFGENF